MAVNGAKRPKTCLFPSERFTVKSKSWKSRYFKSKIAVMVAALACPLLFGGCSVKYSLSGASIAPEIQTVSIARFPNNALLVAPILSSTLTDALQDRFTRQTRLAVVPENGDLRFEGEITNYTSTPAAVSGEEMAVMNRLTITVRVRFTNAFQPEFNYDKTFSAFSDYSSSRLLQEAEPTLIPEIVDQLVENIFNDAVSNW